MGSAVVDIAGRVAVVTGAGDGIGAALCRRLAGEGAAGVVVSDLDEAKATRVADEIGGLAVRADVSNQADIEKLASVIRSRFGRIDIYFSNAGVDASAGRIAPGLEWPLSLQVNLMAHVHAASCVLPEMAERGEGYFVITSSAAGLLTHVTSAPYAVSKHAAVAYAEWLAIIHGPAGVRVSCLCPQAVRTDTLAAVSDDPRVAAQLAAGGIIEPDEVADHVVNAMRDERFLILPHPRVDKYMKRKAADIDEWIRQMQMMLAEAAT
jgi:NAD(P)-dependent dehydrogenase (short-subunit alcohol dehydrogenase family)